jgi:hypothetical protein
MSYNTKNYTEQGGDKTVIGGTLEIKQEASVTGFPLQRIRQIALLPISLDLVTDVNALLSKLKAAGLMVADE